MAGGSYKTTVENVRVGAQFVYRKNTPGVDSYKELWGWKRENGKVEVYGIAIIEDGSVKDVTGFGRKRKTFIRMAPETIISVILNEGA